MQESGYSIQFVFDELPVAVVAAAVDVAAAVVASVVDGIALHTKQIEKR